MAVPSKYILLIPAFSAFREIFILLACRFLLFLFAPLHKNSLNIFSEMIIIQTG